MISALSFVALAASPALPPVGAAELALYLPDGATVERRIDADVTGDGIRDTVAIGRTDEDRRLVVLAGYVEEVDMGYRPIGELKMDPAPLGTAGLSVKAGVLIVEDLTGGTTAISSLYRFRFDPAAQKMRLIGDDVELYSRTYAHGGVKISTNRLTGQRITTRKTLAGRGANARYVAAKPVTSYVPRSPVYMEDAPDPAETLGWGD